MSFSYDQRQSWYKFACLALFAMPLLVLGQVLPTMAGLAETLKVDYVVWQSSAAATLGLFAIRMRESARMQVEENSTSWTVLRKNVGRAGDNGINLFALFDALRIEDVVSNKSPEVDGAAIPGSRTSQAARNVVPSDKSQQAKRVDSATAGVQRITPAGVSSLKAQKDPAASARQPLSPEESKSLFSALLKGTQQAFEREPTASEFGRLVDAVERTVRPNQMTEAAQAGTLLIHWSGSSWVFAFDESSDATPSLPLAA